jgi:hypothetical protein
MWARAHIARSDCAFALKASVERALEFYRRINSYVRRTGAGYYLRIGDLRTPFFRTKGELARWLGESGLLDKLKGVF